MGSHFFSVENKSTAVFFTYLYFIYWSDSPCQLSSGSSVSQSVPDANLRPQSSSLPWTRWNFIHLTRLNLIDFSSEMPLCCSTGYKDYAVARDRIPASSSPSKTPEAGSLGLRREHYSYREWFRFQTCWAALQRCLLASFGSEGTQGCQAGRWKTEERKVKWGVSD